MLFIRRAVCLFHLFFASFFLRVWAGQATASQTPSAHYYYSTVPTSRLRIPLQIGAGDVGVYYLEESPEDVGEGSAVECWVDNNYGGAVRLENSAMDLSSGKTRETCVLQFTLSYPPLSPLFSCANFADSVFWV
jgi:hypothetical protein